MKTVFAGTPEFARVALEAIAEAGFEIALVLTQPDRPAGRGMKLQASPVKQFAIGRGIPVAQPRSLRLDGKYPEDAAAARAALEAAGADVMVVAAFGLILPQWVLDLPRLGCLNIHASLLPRWRGAAPIHRAIEAGDETTGVTIMQMDAGLDTGAMLLTESLAIGGDSTARLHDRLAALGGRMIVEALHKAGRGELRPVAQPGEGVNYAHKVDKAEALLDWSQPAVVLARRIRAFDPAPGAGSVLDGVPIKVWAAEPDAADRDADRASGGAAAANARNAPNAPNTPNAPNASVGAPGTVLAVSATGIEVAVGASSILRITELQRSGGKRLPVAEFLRGFDVKPGQVFG